MAMEVRQEPLSLYASSRPENIVWPAIPQHPPQHHPAPADLTLPNLKAVLSGFEPASPASNHHGISHHSHGSPRSIHSLPPIEAGFGLRTSTPKGVESVVVSPAESGGAMSPDERSRSVVSMDDPDVRIAAEALSGLGSSEYTRLPPITSPDLHSRTVAAPEEQEPLLELIAQAHPWVGGTIKGSLSAYSTTKNFSPRIVQYGANLVERNITIPVVSAVSSVGGMTGVEHNLRRYLDSRRPGDLEASPAQTSNKRKISSDAPARLSIGYMDTPQTPDIRRDSMDSRYETLPRYGASRPPSYREEESPASTHRSSQDIAVRPRPVTNRSWSSQFLVSTSGLSVALSTTSRRSLRYCLGLIGTSADRVAQLTTALSMILSEYEKARANFDVAELALEKGASPTTSEQHESAHRLAEAIKRHSDDIWHTLRYVVDSVSNYAGGALPENARHFVRQQLMSLPQRWRIVSDGQSGQTETSRSAQRMIDFAREGLDMMTQVSGVLKATLDSAEKWLERVGRRDRNAQDEEDQAMIDAPWQAPTNVDQKL